MGHLVAENRKKLLFVCSLVLLGMQSVSAQGDFKLGAGVGVGTTGVAIDVSATYGNYLGARFGVDIMPKIKVNKGIDLKTEDANKQISTMTSEINDLNAKLREYGLEEVDLSRFPGGNLPNKMDVQGKLNNTTWHFLIDVYPFGGKSSFHATVGAYFGPSDIVTVYNKEQGFLQPIVAYNEALINAAQYPDVQTVVNRYNLKMIGAELGDYFLTPNPVDKGDVEAMAKVNSFRYIQSVAHIFVLILVHLTCCFITKNRTHLSMIFLLYLRMNASAMRLSFDDNGGTPCFSRILIRSKLPFIMISSNILSSSPCFTCR